MVYTRSTSAMIQKVEETERRLARVCDQVRLLRDRHTELTQRRDAARERDQRNYVYNLTLRMSVFEGVINVLYEYIRNIAEEIHDMRWLIFRQVVILVADNDGELSDEDAIISDDGGYTDDEIVTDFVDPTMMQ